MLNHKKTPEIVMSAVKQEVQHILNTLPEDCTYEDVQYHLYVLEKVKCGLDDVEQGRVFTQEEVEQHLSRWLK